MSASSRSEVCFRNKCVCEQSITLKWFKFEKYNLYVSSFSSLLSVTVQLSLEAYICSCHYLRNHQNLKLLTYLDFLVHIVLLDLSWDTFSDINALLKICIINQVYVCRLTRNWPNNLLSCQMNWSAIGIDAYCFNISNKIKKIILKYIIIWEKQFRNYCKFTHN